MTGHTVCASSINSTLGIVIVLLYIVISGCAFVRGNIGDELNEAAVAEVKKGVTTRAEVTATFGAPDEILQAAGREIFHYRRYDGKLGYLVILSRLNVKSDNLYVLFTSEGVVHDVVYGKRTNHLDFQVWPFGD
jgi:outer membrane protein assembly factor BamE (lipoprotein component of BamABCDE complex)